MFGLTPDYNITINITVDRKLERDLFNLLYTNTSFLTDKDLKAIIKFIKEQTKANFKPKSSIVIEEIGGKNKKYKK